VDGAQAVPGILRLGEEEGVQVDSDYPYHYLGSPRTMLRIGRAFGEAVLELRENKRKGGR
jgi:hypothetical protein